jgi:trans-aconitate methyltransferase
MTDPAARAVIFGRDAATYDAARPSYPADAIRHIQNLVPAEQAVEIGAGTGKATADIARPGLEILCLEPSPQMADILAERELPGVTVVVSTFEEWDEQIEPVDLVYAAQAWHWVDHSTAYRRVLELLRPGGVMALIWNIPQERYETFAAVYEEHAPELLSEQDRRIMKRDSVTWSEDMASAGFTDVDRTTFQWHDTLTPDQTRDLYSTYSDHMMLVDEQRHALLEGLHDAVVARGGTADFEYRTEVFSGRKTDT